MKNKTLLFIFLIIDLCLVCLCIWLLVPIKDADKGAAGEAMSAERASFTGRYKEILTQEEKEDWNQTEIQPGKVFLKLNTRIKVTGGNQAYIRLINPPYSTYDYQFRVTGEEGDVLYESDVLTPGSLIEHVTLNEELKEEQTEGWVLYTFYKSGEKEQKGTRKVAAMLDTSK